MGIFELMELDDEIRKLIMTNADASVLHAYGAHATACAICAKTVGSRCRTA